MAPAALRLVTDTAPAKSRNHGVLDVTAMPVRKPNSAYRTREHLTGDDPRGLPSWLKSN